MALRAVLPRTESTWASVSLSVVLPAVPVTATTLALVALRQRAAMRPRAFTVSGTSSHGQARSGKRPRSQERHRALFPRLAREIMSVSTLARHADKERAGVTSRLSVTTEVTQTSSGSAALPNRAAI